MRVQQYRHASWADVDEVVVPNHQRSSVRRSSGSSTVSPRDVRLAAVTLTCPLLAGCGPHLDGIDAVTPQGDSISGLFLLSLILSSLVFLLVAGLARLVLVRYRAGRAGRARARLRGNRRLEIAWTVAPALLLTGLFVLTMRTMLDVRTHPPMTLRVEVIGHQWWWEYRYPDGTS